MDTKKPFCKPPGVPNPVEIPDNDFDEYLEWSEEEEAEFLKVIEDSGKPGENE